MKTTDKKKADKVWRQKRQIMRGEWAPHLRCVLEYIGTPVEEIPLTVRELKLAYNLARRENPEKFREAYDIIVHHKLPSGVKDDAATDKQKHFLGLSKFMEQQNEFYLGEFRKYRNDSKKAMDEKMLELNGKLLDDALKIAQQAIAEESKKYRTIAIKIGDKKVKKLKGTLPKEFDRIVQLAQQRLNILLVGPAGCGKTFLAGKVADALGLEYGSQSCSAGMSESQLAGWLLPTGKTGNFEYVPSEFVKRYEQGGVFLLDELDAADPNVLIFINQALANDEFYLPQRFENPRVKKHKDFVAIGAANTFGHGADVMYHGRNALDAATLDRFKIGTVNMSYDDGVEGALIDPEILQWGRKIRGKIASNGLRKIMSTRVMKDATEMKRSQDWSIDDIANAYFSDWSTEEKAMMSLD